MLSAFTEPNISIRERAQLAWSGVSFLRPWKVRINISRYTSGLSAVECLLYATLKVHYIFLLIMILLSSLLVARVNAFLLY